ncbi:hypothetical protein E2562_028352 [Oryza meyeriana var. granulata]|uniref:Uncharacterized protein n=1 Tax=Oryza meyeriana var. granulata TaxID=110450 RepID=A0A6G1CU93_9ORYZ|nr:hypothetical protein E2562_028352 [Oryza meyeriana var. granulata]
MSRQVPFFSGTGAGDPIAVVAGVKGADHGKAKRKLGGGRTRAGVHSGGQGEPCTHVTPEHKFVWEEYKL